MRYYKDLLDKYHGTLDRMYQLYKFVIEREEDLAKKLDLARDELTRIKVCPGATKEIIELCERGLAMTETKPVE